MVIELRYESKLGEINNLLEVLETLDLEFHNYKTGWSLSTVNYSKSLILEYTAVHPSKLSSLKFINNIPVSLLVFVGVHNDEESPKKEVAQYDSDSSEEHF